MKNSRKNLKGMSILIFVFALITCVRHVLSIFVGDFDMATIPEGSSAGLVLALQIVSCVTAVILMIPDFYIGIKGIKVANNPDSSKAHIVWATILAIFAVIGALSAVSGMTKGGDILDNIFNVIGSALNVAIYAFYIAYAKQVRKNA